MGNLLETRYLFVASSFGGARGGECLASSRAKDLVQTFSKLLGGGLVGGGGHGNQHGGGNVHMQ
jgi:hypothetical protein